jgi:outer membrane protein W
VQFVEGGTELTWGAELGVDLRLGDSRWTLGASAEYLQTSLNATRDYWWTSDFDPVIVSLGFGYRF